MTGILDVFTDGFIFYPMMLLGLFALGCLLFQAFCILWSPFAAIICALDAYQRNMSIWRYAVAGGLCSIFFFIPWVHLRKAMQGERSERITRASIHSAFTGIHFLWLLWVVTYLVSTVLYMEFNDASFFQAEEIWNGSRYRNIQTFWLMNGAINLLAGVALLLSWMNKVLEQIPEFRNAHEVQLFRLAMRSRVRLVLPFALTSLNITAPPTLLFIWYATN